MLQVLTELRQALWLSLDHLVPAKYVVWTGIASLVAGLGTGLGGYWCLRRGHFISIPLYGALLGGLYGYDVSRSWPGTLMLALLSGILFVLLTSASYKMMVAFTGYVWGYLLTHLVLATAHVHSSPIADLYPVATGLAVAGLTVTFERPFMIVWASMAGGLITTVGVEILARPTGWLLAVTLALVTLGSIPVQFLITQGLDDDNSKSILRRSTTRQREVAVH